MLLSINSSILSTSWASFERRTESSQCKWCPQTSSVSLLPEIIFEFGTCITASWFCYHFSCNNLLFPAYRRWIERRIVLPITTSCSKCQCYCSFIIFLSVGLYHIWDLYSPMSCIFFIIQWKTLIVILNSRKICDLYWINPVYDSHLLDAVLIYMPPLCSEEEKTSWVYRPEYLCS